MGEDKFMTESKGSFKDKLHAGEYLLICYIQTWTLGKN
ncbi:hypothetical protein ADIARSV_1784 [Arcticibacter svalbardensis MN12-7]|uniref:Uncharacterized protein n=1 Tax=Arcticibacter svalbardensis MN12-7 TaxID=1150600 RepID=R9GTX7_9SPHI|nr:hypothetical protein ADIARSV_1784 [Arcticibacter svalbardensis MN12-7]